MRVVVIGTGATAATLVPTLARIAAHVTLLQRSPSWVMSLRSRSTAAEQLHRLLPDRLADPLVRWRSIALGRFSYRLSRHAPRLVMIGRTAGVVDVVARLLPAGYKRVLVGMTSFGVRRAGQRRREGL